MSPPTDPAATSAVTSSAATAETKVSAGTHFKQTVTTISLLKHKVKRSLTFLNIFTSLTDLLSLVCGNIYNDFLVNVTSIQFMKFYKSFLQVCQLL